ncbi:carbon-nitrogen family hydrolase [Peribacillus sp. SCS-155]|uniref:carbon-nitrogen family hydrolase n=1 Tax=Peribacillus sedimenti TaxID=3115297 RepID=UPI003905D9C8
MNWTIACIQMDIAFGDPQQNYRSAAEKIEKAAESKPDIIVLPELWTTGYDLGRLDEIADNQAQDTLAFLQEAALKYNVNFVGGSVAKKTQAGVFNSLLIVNRQGMLIKDYDKLHLFQLMKEHHFLKPGQKDGLFSLEGYECAGFICYDIRFPEWIRSHTSRGAKAIFVVAEWPMPRLAHWKALLISRAIENQAFVIGVNRCGSDPDNKFAGHSMIIDPWGNILQEAGDSEEILVGTIDLAMADAVRNMIPVFQDRRPEFY